MTTTCFTITMHHITCGACGVLFGITSAFMDARKEDHKTWHCPNGCNRWYPDKNELEVAKASLRRERDRNVMERARHDQTKAELEYTENRRRGEKAAKTRIKNRVANGVCPCCNRQFVNLHRHMETKHPDFVGDPQ